MNKTKIMAAVVLLLAVVAGVQGQTYAAWWEKIREAEEKGLPKSVIACTEEIQRKAEKEQCVGQLFKAVLWREAAQQRLTPDSLLPALIRMEQWVERETDPVSRALLHSLLAGSYADYLQRHVYVINRRTDLLPDEAVPADFRQWSRSLFLRAIERHVDSSLADEELLMGTDGSAYQPLVVLQKASAHYRHDLYHVLARRAVWIYLQTGGTASERQEHIGALYERMLSAYNRQPDKEAARLLVAVDYLRWADEEGYRPVSLASPHVLDSLMTLYVSQPCCLEAYLLKAERLLRGGEEQHARTLQVCEEGLHRYPKNPRTALLKQMKHQILAPSFHATLPRVSYPGDSLALQLSYRRVNGFRLTAYATALTEYPENEPDREKQWTALRHKRLWSRHFDLPQSEAPKVESEARPYLTVNSRIATEIPLPVGVCLLELEAEGNGQRITCRQLVSVSRLMAMTLSLPNREQEMQVVDWKSGAPVPGAFVRCYTRPSQAKDSLLYEAVTDAQGRCPLRAGQRWAWARIATGEDRALPPVTLSSVAPYRVGDGDKEREEIRLLTDRSIYRPGQRVYLKGFVYRQNEEIARVVPQRELEVKLLDANGKELERRRMTSNDFGTFATDFLLPAHCLNGRFTIRAGQGQSVTFRVEAYKRPTFEVEFQTPKQPYVCGDTLPLAGTVRGYQGMPVQHTAVAYRLTAHRYDHYRWRASAVEPLLQDTVYTDERGRFLLSLPLHTSSALEGVANVPFRVDVTVLSPSGETQQESYTLAVGSRAYRFGATLPPTVCREDSLRFAFTLHNQANEPQNQSGTYRLYRLPREGSALSSAVPQGAQPVCQGKVEYNQIQTMDAWRTLPSGRYRLVLESGRAGKYQERDTLPAFTLFSRYDTRPISGTPLFVFEENTSFDEEHPAVIYWGTSCREAHVLFDLFSEERRMECRTRLVSDTLMRMEIPYRKEYGKSLSFLLGFVKEGEYHHSSIRLQKRESVERLRLKWEVMRDRLLPGQQEEWRLSVMQGDRPVDAEMLALLYDASLDRLSRPNPTFVPHFYRSVYFPSWQLCYRGSLSLTGSFPIPSVKLPVWRFDEIVTPSTGVWGYAYPQGNVKLTAVASAPMTKRANAEMSGAVVIEDMAEEEVLPEHSDAGQGVGEDILPVRTDFSETAYFYPQLRTDEQGGITLSFTMPQSLTRWNFVGFAHTRQMAVGTLRASVVTAKDFMLQSGLPRYLREGDETELTATVSNLTPDLRKGMVRLTLFDPLTDKVLLTRKAAFEVSASESQTVRFLVRTPKGKNLVAIRLVADSDRFSDGEQQVLPVLSDRTYVTETLPFLLQGEGVRSYSLDTLFQGRSPHAAQRSLTVEVTGNPAWYALTALPALEQPSSDNAIAWAVSLYTHRMAHAVLASRPGLRELFQSWRLSDTGQTLQKSPLQQNEELRELLLAETPWVMEAEEESRQKQRLAHYFDENQMAYRRQTAVAKLAQLQQGNGAWAWFDGMQPSFDVTVFVVQQLARMQSMAGGDPEVVRLADRAVGYLHGEMEALYRTLSEREERDGIRPSFTSRMGDYLYLLALGEFAVPEGSRKAVDYFLRLCEAHRLEGPVGQKARNAVILLRHRRTAAAHEVLRSLCEHLTVTESDGAHFAFLDESAPWGMCAEAAHVACMEALCLAGGHEELLERMKQWLVRRKETRQWDSPVASVNAIHALLMQGTDLLEQDGEVRLTLGKTRLQTTSSDAAKGPAYLKRRFGQDSPVLEARRLTVEKRGGGMAWGALYASCLMPLGEVRQQGSGLEVEKRLYVERLDVSGRSTLQLFVPGVTPLRVGDKVVARLTLRLERGMDFVTLNDQRGACFEPLTARSGYRLHDGVGCYVEIKDAATRFFFDHLPKGVHVVEHTYLLSRAGTYQAGMATLQSAYAPRFSAHSSSVMVSVEGR